MDTGEAEQRAEDVPEVIVKEIKTLEEGKENAACHTNLVNSLSVPHATEPIAATTLADLSASSHGEAAFGATEGTVRTCNCRQSQCLKLYCECFTSQRLCRGCSCQGCRNQREDDPMRIQAVKKTLQRDPAAFQRRIVTNPVVRFSDGPLWRPVHRKGCNCKKTHCLKKYCECFNANIYCSENCKCQDCRNYEGSHDRQDLEDRGLAPHAMAHCAPRLPPVSQPSARVVPSHAHHSAQHVAKPFELTDGEVSALCGRLLRVAKETKVGGRRRLKIEEKENNPTLPVPSLPPRSPSSLPSGESNHPPLVLKTAATMARAISSGDWLLCDEINTLTMPEPPEVPSPDTLQCKEEAVLVEFVGFLQQKLQQTTSLEEGSKGGLLSGLHLIKPEF